MTVYVDDWRQPARVGRVTARWSHLTVGPDGDLAELHAFAAAIGLRRAWFQDKPWPRAHYDVTDSKRRQAIAAGAVPVTWREAAQQRLTALQSAGAAAPGGGGAAALAVQRVPRSSSRRGAVSPDTAAADRQEGRR